MNSEFSIKPRGIIWLQALVIISAGVWAFSPALRGTWLWDDDQYLTQNTLLRTPAGLAKIWLAPAGVNYFPLTSTIQWVQWHLWSDAPLGYHWTNVSLHLLSALLLWRLLHKGGMRQAWLGGLLFAVHPLAVESVAWISELKNTLSLPFLLLAAGCYLDSDNLRSQKTALLPYFSSLFFFLLAMLCKSTVVMFPLVILLYLWWKRGRLTLAGLGASAPFFALSLSLGSVTLWFERARAIGSGAAPLEGFFLRTIAAGLSAGFYLLKCLFPTGLMPIYPRWTVDPPTLLQLLPWPLLGVCLGVLWTKRKTWGRGGLFGLGCFLVNLVPALGFVPMAYLRLAWAADHFAYLSLACFCGLAAAAWSWVRFPAGAAARSATWPALRVLPLVIAAALACGSHRYAGNFRSPEALWTFTLRKNPGAWSAHNDLGSIRYDAGQLPEATAEFAEAVRLKPDYAEARNNLGVALADAGRLPEAVAQYEQALRLKPEYANARCNLGNAWLRMGRLPEAVSEYRRALELKSDFPEVHYNLGLALRALGRNEEAAGEFGLAKGLGGGR